MSRRPPPETRTLGDIVQGIVADIREKVVEEPWFGRPLGPGQPIPPHYEIMCDPPPRKWTGLSRPAFGLGGADIA